MSTRSLRPKDAAAKLGISLRTFYAQAANDADFPVLIHLGPRCTVVREADLDAWLEKKAAAARRRDVREVAQ